MSKQYTIQLGDSLNSICYKFNVSPQQIINANVFTYPSLVENPYMMFIGWNIRIPTNEN